jgi:3-mercaptopyruvate sulfurtransferase SseA
VRAALATIVLKVLGFDRARNFDGSFQQWSRDEQAPIER